jgi:L-aspartate oxidase
MKPVIIGAGLAGLCVALSLAPMPVLIVSSRQPGDGGSSNWAQGGLAAAVGADDTPDLHAGDTLRTGAGLCDPDIVRQVTQAGPDVVAWLVNQGVAFDCDDAGRFRLGLEAAHNRRRIVHAAGDATGAVIMKTLIAAAQKTPSIEILHGASATELLTDDGLTGVVIEHKGTCFVLPTTQVILATGGAGALWQHTTNPLGSWGQGLVLAARAGATLADLEFMQFHPTAVDVGRDPMPLASEALRGEGAVLIDENGERFMRDFLAAELEPRDVVARVVWQHIKDGHRAFLDARKALGDSFPKRFPSIYNLCRTAGIDPVNEPIPVHPAAHFHMGGVMTDAHGRSSIKGLWACGEVACTGLHGANRLASNSLLEAVWSGQKVAADVQNANIAQGNMARSNGELGFRQNDNMSTDIRRIMSAHVGVLRDKRGLEVAINQLLPLSQKSDMALAGLMIATAAMRREESRGSHTRTDYPASIDSYEHQQCLTLANVLHTSLPDIKKRRA